MTNTKKNPPLQQSPLNDSLHDYLLELKNKNSQDPNIGTYKKKIREYLIPYRSDLPITRPTSSFLDEKKKDIVFYSFMEAPGKPHIAQHEYKRLKISWSSLRKHNTDIEVRFCYNGSSEGMWSELCDDFGIQMWPFHSSFTGKEPNAWCIHLSLEKREPEYTLYGCRHLCKRRHTVSL